MYKAARRVAYGADLRISEVVHLKLDDIDSQCMLIRAENGKGRRDRNAMLLPPLLELLRIFEPCIPVCGRQMHAAPRSAGPCGRDLTASRRF